MSEVGSECAAPSPGSDEALDLGCTCPVLDNAHGKGAQGTWDKPEGEKLFWITWGCPLHAPKTTCTDENAQETP
jgi:hypothetical protein